MGRPLVSRLDIREQRDDPLTTGLPRSRVQDQGRAAHKKCCASEMGKDEKRNRRTPTRIGSR